MISPRLIDNSIFKRVSKGLLLALCAVSLIEAYVLSDYVYTGNIPHIIVISVLALILFCSNLLYWLIRKHTGMDVLDINIAVFSLMLSAVLIIGKHIVVSDTYSGTVEVNYLLPFSAGIIIIFLVLFAALVPIFSDLAYYSCNRKAITIDESKKLNIRQMVITGAVLSVFYLVYLFVYWPGIITSDVLISVNQIGQSNIDNRNPIVYTLFIKFLFIVTGVSSTKDITLALGLLDIIQAVYFAFSVSYMITWICSKTSAHRAWQYILPFLFMVFSFVGIQTITMLKDPIFNASIINISVFLLDYAILEEKPTNSLCWCIHFVMFLLLVLFWRNNGICAAIAVIIGLIIMILSSGNILESLMNNSKLLLIIGCLSVGYLIIVGPVFSHFQIGTPREESVGIMLQQMASVAAKEGNISTSEKEYLNSVLPLEEYHDAYKPCSVDLLKWNSHMNYEPLYSLIFYKNWLSLYIKNPYLYFESWVMETFGFWTVNTESINSVSSFYIADVPSDQILTIGGYSININNLFGGDTLRNIFTNTSWVLPVGILNWFLFFVIICLKKKDKSPLILCTLPVLGVAIGLIIGSPIFYLVRYEASVEYLLPLFLTLFFC